MSPCGNHVEIETDSPPGRSTLQTKIVVLTSSEVSEHSYRDGNGNVALIIDSMTKNVMNFDHACEFDHEKLDYDSNS